MKTNKPSVLFRKALTVVVLLFAAKLTAQTGTSCSNAITVSTFSYCNFQSYITSTDQMWFKFVAQSKDVNISVITTKFGLNAPHIHNIALYSGTCGSPNYITDDELPFETNADRLSIDLNASGLIIGNTYFIKANRKAENDDCDKGTCKSGGSTSPTAFNLCVENINVLVPLDFGIEPPATYHAYEQNRGQLVDASGNPVPQIKMFTKSNPAVYIGDNFTSFVFEKLDKNPATMDSTHRVDMTLSGSNSNTRVFKTEQLPGVNNYYLAHVPKGITNNKSFSRSVINNIYPKIDVQYYSNRDGVKIYFILHPGADPELLKLKFSGAISTGTTASGGLDIKTALGNLTFEKAHVYKINSSNNVVPFPVSGKFVNVGADEYKIYLQNFPPDNMPVIIQIDRGHSTPNSVAQNTEWGTFFGGNSDDEAHDMCTDASGSMYATGTTLSPNFPQIGFQTSTLKGGRDAFIVKFDNNYARIWATFFGGNGIEDGFGITHDKLNDKIYFCGRSTSTGTSLPVQALSGSANSYADNIANTDKGFIVRVEPVNGSKEWSTNFGGGSPSFCSKIKADNNGNVFVIGDVGFTGIQSNCMPPSGSQYPICNPGGGAYSQTVNASVNFGVAGNTPQFLDGYIAKFNSQTELKWSTLFGGNGDDNMRNLAIDNSNQKLYIVGGTRSNNLLTPLCAASNSDGRFPLCNPSGSYFQQAINGNNVGSKEDGFISRFSLNGNLEWCTFFGGNQNDAITDVALDNFGNPFVTGYTETSVYGSNCQVSGINFPLCASGFTQAFGGVMDAFVSKFSLTGSLLWSTFYGGTQAEGLFEINAFPRIAINQTNNNVFISGTTRSCSNLNLTPNATFYQQNKHGDDSFTPGTCTSPPAGASDGYVAGFSNSGNIIYSSYFGGRGINPSITPSPGDVVLGLTTFQDRVYVCGRSFSRLNTFPFNCPPTVNPFCDPSDNSVSNSQSTAFFAQINKTIVGINEFSKNKHEQFKVYPNPSNSLINFEWQNENSKKADISVYNSIGQLVVRIAVNETYGQNTQTINIALLPPGVYITVIKTDAQLLNAKFIKE